VVAVIVAVPVATPVTFPSAETVATFSSLDVYVAVAADGQTLRVVSTVSPIVIFSGALVNLAPAPTVLTFTVNFLEIALPDFLAVTLTRSSPWCGRWKRRIYAGCGKCFGENGVG